MEGAFFWWRNENARNEQDSRLSLRDDRQEEEESAEGIYEERPEGREIIESLGQEGYAEECCEEAQGQSPEARDGKDNEARFGWRSFGRNVFVQTDKEKEK